MRFSRNRLVATSVSDLRPDAKSARRRKVWCHIYPWEGSEGRMRLRGHVGAEGVLYRIFPWWWWVAVGLI